MISEPWHLDKKFSIGIIIAILGQCACFVWYGSKLDSKVQDTSAQVTELRLWKDRQDDDKAKIAAHLAVIDEKLLEQSTVLHRIDDRMDRYTSHGR